MNPCRTALLVCVVTLLPATVHAQPGVPVWTNYYNGPGDNGDSGSAVAVDPASGNVYMAGSANNSVTSQDYVTIAYSSAGVPLWTNLCAGLGGTDCDYLKAVAVDPSSGNVVVTGNFSTGASTTMGTVAYSSAGVPLWTNKSFSGAGYDVVADASGNVFVTGSAYTIKLSSAGAVLWAKNTSGGALALDSSGNVIVNGSSGHDYATYKYSNNGALLWFRSYNGPASLTDSAASVAVDSSDNVVVSGWSQTDGAGLIAYATIKYSSAGVPLWTNRYERVSAETVTVAVDRRGDVYLAGEGDTADLVKYSSAGELLWTNRIGGEPGSLALDTSGNVYLARQELVGNFDFDWLTVAYSSGGVPLWTNRFYGPITGSENPLGITVDASGSVYVTGLTGTVNADTRNQDAVMLKFVTPPVITRHPLNCTNAVGTTACFSVEAAGHVPLSYQWQRQGTNLVDGGTISGVTTTNLLIANVQPADAAGYSVVMTNTYGSATSSVAQLTVVSPGRFTNFTYSPVMGFSFIFRDGTPGRPYRIQFSASPAAVSWTDWMSFTYTGPAFLTDMGVTSLQRRFYRAVSP